MSFANFSPLIVSQKMMMDLKEEHVFAKWCDRNPETELKNAGDTVKFRSLGEPALTDLDFEDRNDEFPSLHRPEDSAFIMQVRRIVRFNEAIGKIDDLISDKKLMPVIRQKIVRGLAGKADRYIANFATRAETPRLYSTPKQVTSSNVLDVIDEAGKMLFDNGVPESEPILLTCSSRFYLLAKNAYRDLDTDNSDILKLGKVGKYNDVSLQRSRNVAVTDNGTTDRMLCRTKGFMGFAELVKNLVPYIPDKYVDDAIKGEYLYDAKILRPKEGFSIDCTYAQS